MFGWLIGCALQFGCGDVDENEPIQVTTDGSTEATSHSAGADIFAQYCAACHGAGGEGQEGMAEDLRKGRYANGQLSTTEVFELVKNGRMGSTGLMPPWGGILSDDQIVAVLMYMDQEFSER